MAEQIPHGNRLHRLVEHLRHGEGVVLATGAARQAARGVRSVVRVGDAAGRARMVRLLAESALGREEDQRPASSARPFRVPELGDRIVWLRPRSRDLRAFQFLAEGHHMPPADMPGPVRHIAVFGANIGLLLADLADEYPEARVLGVEPDTDNAVLARRNLEHLGGRGRIVETAVWHRDATLQVGWDRDAWGVNITDTAPEQPPAASDDSLQPRIEAADAGRILADWTGGAPVDYLLVNVESAWQELLAHGDWARDVRCIKVEISDARTVAVADEAVPMLEKLGFRARLQTLPWGAFAIGLR
ncbi:hypothetical protein [Pseudonocardia sp. WMMC193]|uniref:hypothetical protein n=1 Tax=Pseudonocardia sp. WMMC193 TaxID=2911965 RepID=UPI001F2CE150|nr:hypothetical protein [Pseudonocardia sp. WMMC193]MCF7549013.1 hypothetical protein [Pseudonocardia sp. WMMC193]